MAQPLPQEDLDFILRRTPDLWEELRNQRIFLTGGTGFFGAWLLETLLAANSANALGVQITVLTRNPEAFRRSKPYSAQHPAVTLLAGNVRDFAFPFGEFRYVIHAATETWARPESGGPADLLDAILGGTERVLRFAATHGTEKFLFTSSGAVYGTQPQDISQISEQYLGAPDPLAPGSAYAEGKRGAEAFCASYARQYGLACKIARCFAFAGPLLALDQHFAFGNFIHHVLHGEPIHIRGDGTARRSYMYAADLARWLWTMLLRAPAAEAFNVGSPQSVSIKELAMTVQDALGSTTGIKIDRQATEGAPVQQYVPCVRKAESCLGLRCEVSLEEAIRKTARYHGWTRPSS
jgi:nucleoside-diphosphate-sugar epimerase